MGEKLEKPAKKSKAEKLSTALKANIKRRKMATRHSGERSDIATQKNGHVDKEASLS